jgi:hypothetical protein
MNRHADLLGRTTSEINASGGTITMTISINMEFYPPQIPATARRCRRAAGSQWTASTLRGTAKMKRLMLGCAFVATMATVTPHMAAAQTSVFIGQGRYQQQATTSCPAGDSCILPLKPIPAGKQVVTTGISCDSAPGQNFFEVYNQKKTKLLFRKVLLSPYGSVATIGLVLDPSHTLQFWANRSNSSNLSCLVVGLIANK